MSEGLSKICILLPKYSYILHTIFHFTITYNICIEYSKTNQLRGHRDPAHHTTTPTLINTIMKSVAPSQPFA